MGRVSFIIYAPAGGIGNGVRISINFLNNDRAPQASAGMLTAILVPDDCFPSLSGFSCEQNFYALLHMSLQADVVLDAK